MTSKFEPLPSIIGVSAKKQGGKSSLVDFLCTKLDSVEIIRMADELKRIVIRCFVPYEWNLTIDDLEREDVKNRMLPCGKTIRQLLQIVGTDQFRSLWEDCWINAWQSVAHMTYAKHVLVPDVRFPNELRVIQKMGGFVIRLTRAPFANQDQHSSETALDQVEYDTLNVMDDSPVGHRELVFDYVYQNEYVSLEEKNKWAREVLLPYMREWTRRR